MAGKGAVKNSRRNKKFLRSVNPAQGLLKHEKVNILSGLKPAFKRLARKAGVLRISDDSYNIIGRIANIDLERVLGNAVAFTEYGKRKTVSPKDVHNALSHIGRPLYGRNDRSI